VGGFDFSPLLPTQELFYGHKIATDLTEIQKK
jgi:hypothetical protein